MMLPPPILPSVLDQLCPMHLVVGPTGHITHVGPTLRKLRPGADWLGERLLEVVRILRPRALETMPELVSVAGRKLHLELRDPPRTTLKGIAVVQPGSNELILNLSFGISVIEAVQDFSLTNADFAATDLTVEMLYLLEAKSAAMEASRKLNLHLQGAKRAAEEQAVTDTLTGLKNRRALDRALARFLSTSTPFALMHLDLDFFKAVNDTLGHAAGDFVLMHVARSLRDLTREGDVIARVGGDEFVLILPACIDRAVIERIGTSIIEKLETPLDYKGTPARISGSIGTITWDGREEAEIEQLMDDADVALYASKHAGRGQQTFYHPGLREAAAGQPVLAARRDVVEG